MEAFSPMGETVMDTSSVLSSPQSSHLMMGMGEESMDTLTMSPKSAENQETNKERLQQIPAPVLSADGTLHSLNTPFAGSLSNLVLPGIPNAATATTSFFLNATNPTTVAAPFLLNQSNLTTATAGAHQFLMNGSTGVQPNTTFLLNTSPGGSNMQTFLLNPNMAAQGTPLVVQTPQTNTAFLVNPGMLNTSPSTLLLTHPGLAGSNGALMLTANQGTAAAMPQVQPTMTAAPAENVVDASSSEVQVQPQTNDAGALQLRTLQLPVGNVLPGTLIQTDGAQNVILQQRVEQAESDTSSVSELSQGIVEENSITENIRENKDMLALRLKLRRPREELVSQGIMPPLKATTPAFHEQRQRLERAKVGDSLQRKMRMRPDKAQLVHHHILEDTNMEPMVSATHQRLKRARIEQDLDCKIKNRPGPLELIEGNILKAEHFVEQAVKDGKVKFLKTNEMDTCDDSPYNFDEDSQEGGSDEPMSPPQPYSQQSDNPPSSVGSIPSPPDFTSYYEHHMIPPSITSSSPIHIKIPSTPPTTMSMITIKQEPGVTSPPPIVSLPNAVTSSSPSSSKSGSSSSSKNARKKQTKRNKPKEIKFHEYKPPNEQANKLAIPPNASNPYNLLLMQQQLLLQLQLLQQQHHQLILPNAPNISTTSSKLTSNNPGSQSPSSTTVTSSSSPTPQDNKSSVANCTKTRILSNLEDMKVSELKMELKNRGLHVSGTKPQLVERLRPYADVSMSPVATANSTNQDVTSSSSCSGSGGTKVTSSTDAGQEVASETSSARASMSSPPVSPPDFKSPVSVAASELSDPASPGSAFDPMSPSTFQMAPPPSVTTTPSSVLSASSPSNVFSTSSEAQSKQQQQQPTNVQLLNSFQNQTFQMELNDSNSVMEQMMDMSAQLAYNDSAVSSDILRKQQQKIEELQRALRLSQLQLRQHQTNLQSPILSPPPAPPPPPHPAAAAAAAAAGATSVSPKSGSPIKLASINPPPPPSPMSLPSTSNPPSTSISSAIQPPPPPITAVHIKSQSPPKQSSPPVFQPPDFSQSMNQQQRTFTFNTPPTNGQPFIFSKVTPEVKPLSNGLLPGQKSSSLPSSPTDPEAVLGIGGGASLPSYSSPPPNYEEAVRQTKERKVRLGSLLNPTNTETGEPRMTKSQDLDDLLEVLVEHGYQIPVTPKNKDVINLSHTRLPSHISLPSFTMATTSSSSPRLTQAGLSNSTTTGSHHSMPQSQMPHPNPPPPPPPQQQQQGQQQHHQPPAAATPIAIPRSSSAPSPSTMELPMDVDSADMTLNALDVAKSQPNVSKESHLVSSMSVDDKDNANILSFDIPNMQVDGERDSSTFWTFGDHPSPSAGMLGPPSSSDADMNWLDAMMSSSGSGLTPVSVTPPTSIGADGSLGTPLGKEPFSLNLFDLNDDAWDNIHVTD